MPGTDSMIARLDGELEERSAFLEGLIAGAEEAGRDLNSAELEMIGAARDRIGALNAQLGPLRETSRIAIEARTRSRQLNEEILTARRGAGIAPVEYRSAGAYVAELYFAGIGDQQSQERLEVFHRAAAHQTTADNPGLLPMSIIQPIVNFIDAARPIVGTLGPVDLGPGAWSYARVTQHTQVGKQAGEKTELPSRKMTVTTTPLGADTFGGYVNVSKQNINRSSPAILDMIVNDLAAQYAIETENEAADVLTTAATAGPTIPATPTALNIATAIWGAAGLVFAATKGQGRVVVAVSPDMLGVVGPLFPNVNPQNAISSGFTAGGISQGDVGNLSGLSVVMSAGLNTGTILVYSTAAAKAFEYRYGNLQVVEPSVWGVQVGYAGDFDAMVIEPTGVVKVAVA